MTLLTVFAGSVTSAQQTPPRFVSYPGGEGPGNGKHVVLIAGDEEYRSEEAMPMLGKLLSQRHGFRCTVVFSQSPDTAEIDPYNQNHIPGLEALASADLMIIATRFRNLPDAQMKHIDDYLKQGKPVVGLRTATHAFNIPDEASTFHRYHWRSAVKGWEGGFGKQVLGETWVSHHGGHGRESTRGITAPGAEQHPINRGITPNSIWGDSDVYTINLPLAGDAQPIVLGAVLTGMNPDDEVTDRIKKLRNSEKTVVLNDPMMPIAWTRTYEIEPGKRGRVFTSTLGAATDLVAEGSRRMVVQGAFWSLGLEEQIPATGLDVDLVGEFKPNGFGFSGATRLGRSRRV